MDDPDDEVDEVGSGVCGEVICRIRRRRVRLIARVETGKSGRYTSDDGQLRRSRLWTSAGAG